MCIVPKFIIDWFMSLLLFCLKLFVLVTLWTLKVSWHLCFAIPSRTSWILLVMFLLCSKQMYNFQFSIIHDLLFVLLFMLQYSFSVKLLELYLSCLCLEYFDLSLQCFYNKLGDYFVITYLLEDEQELSLGMIDMSQAYL